MTAEPGSAQATPSARCPRCGAAAQGKFCSECGAALTEKPAHPYLLFVDSFFKIGELRRYLALYWRILRAPARVTLELFEQGTLQDALRFLEYSAGILIVIFISQIIAVPGGDLLAGLAANGYFVLAQSVGMALHYRLAVGRVTPRRSFAEFMRLAAVFYGFTLQAVSLAQRTAGSVLFIVVTVPLLVYAVRVWRRFWGLPAWAVFLLLFFSSLAGLAFLFLFKLLFGRYRTYARQRTRHPELVEGRRSERPSASSGGSLRRLA